jgi:hypothetical protein
MSAALITIYVMIIMGTAFVMSIWRTYFKSKPLDRQHATGRIVTKT